MDPLPLLRHFVAINSVNPELVPGAPGEGAIADAIDRILRASGLYVVRQQVAPGRPNIIGIAEGVRPGPTIMLCGHIDTVGVEGMRDPFAPREENGRLYGRGAQDMKGGVAAMIAAASSLSESWTRGKLIVAAVMDEEYMSAGAERLVREQRADMAIITEPTDLRVAVGHKGFAWMEVVTRGRAAHGSRPDEGRDAIARMGRVLVELEAIDRELRAKPPVEFQGTGSLHASFVTGGRELSSYPDRCTLTYERRTVDGERDQVLLREINGVIDRLRHADPEFEAEARLIASRPPYRLDPTHALPSALGAALARGGRSSDPCGMTFWTDAAILAGAGIPTVLFGPGGAGLHSTSEYVTIADVYTCRDVIIDAVRRLAAAS